jgi:hypothetical protein
MDVIEDTVMRMDKDIEIEVDNGMEMIDVMTRVKVMGKGRGTRIRGALGPSAIETGIGTRIGNETKTRIMTRIRTRQGIWTRRKIKLRDCLYVVQVAVVGQVVTLVQSAEKMTERPSDVNDLTTRNDVSDCSMRRL